MFFKEKIKDSQWQEQNTQIIGLTRAGDTATALDRANELLASSRRSFGKKDRRTIIVLGNLGMIHMTRQEFDKAESFYLQALEFCESTLGKASEEYSAITSNLSLVFEAKSKQASAALGSVDDYTNNKAVNLPM